VRSVEGNASGKDLRVALVHDFLLDLRGAERVFLAMCDIWPEAHVYTAVYDESGTEGRLAGRDVRPSFLQRLHPGARNFRALLPFYPAAIESLDLSGYDLVVSSSSAWAHAVICDERSVHVCYCHNPFRYAWNDRDATLARMPDPVSRAVLRALFRRWRQWDWIAAQRVDRYVTNSRTTLARIKSYFGRDSTVVHPPVEVDRFSPGPVGDHYLVLSKLMSHKHIDLAVRAFNLLGLPLIIAGDGPDARRLRRMAGPNVKFAGRVSDAAATDLMRGCRALVVPAVEEFGIAGVEAQAAGRPVVSVARGGALETVVDGVTGCLWEGGPEDLARAIASFDDAAIDPRDCVENASRFSVERFQREFRREVERALETPAERPAPRPAGPRAVRPLRARARRP
jgi:glycosyltransferase involved in cell wall biosynthesis